MAGWDIYHKRYAILFQCSGGAAKLIKSPTNRVSIISVIKGRGQLQTQYGYTGSPAGLTSVRARILLDQPQAPSYNFEGD